MERKSDCLPFIEARITKHLFCFLVVLSCAWQVQSRETESIESAGADVLAARVVNDSRITQTQVTEYNGLVAVNTAVDVQAQPHRNNGKGGQFEDRDKVKGKSSTLLPVESNRTERKKATRGNVSEESSPEGRSGPFLVRAIGPVVSSTRNLFSSFAKSVMDGPAVIHDIEVQDGSKGVHAGDVEHETHPYVGVALAVAAAILVGTSFIFQKRGLLITEAWKLRREAGKQKAGVFGEFAYMLQWTWWCGMLSMAAGEILNFVAYSVAPAILITPLGALRVIVSAVLSAIFLNERLNLHGKIGVLLSLVGSVMIIIHAPRHEKVNTFEEVVIHFTDSGFVLYCVILLSATVFLIFHVAPKRGRTDIMVYISICNIVGALCVLCGKGLGISLKEIGKHGDAVYLHPVFWILVLGNVVGIAVQIVYLNKALAIFNTSMITPIKYVFTNIFLVVGSILLFKEFDFMSGEDIVGISCGFVTVVTGVVLLNLFKDKDSATSVTTKR